jgi:hypothetical protein
VGATVDEAPPSEPGVRPDIQIPAMSGVWGSAAQSRSVVPPSYWPPCHRRQRAARLAIDHPSAGAAEEHLDALVIGAFEGRHPFLLTLW